jgi:hypothetical protein
LKEFAFLKWVLFNDTEAAYALLDSASSYGYRYTKLDNPHVKEAVNISYASVSFLAVRMQNDTVYVMGDSLKKHEFLFTYIIALKLFDLISVGTFETQIGMLSMKNIPLNDFDMNEDFKNLNIYPHMYYLTENWNRYELSMRTDEKTTPFLYCPDIDIMAKLTPGKLPHSIQFDDKTSTFFIGKLKYFTAPFFQAKQFGVLKYYGDENFSIHGIKLNWLLINNRLQSLLHEDYGSLKNLDPSNINISDIYMNNYVVTGGYNFVKKVIEYDEEMKLTNQEIKPILKEEVPIPQNQDIEFDFGDFNIEADIELDFMDTIETDPNQESELLSDHPESDSNSSPDSTERDYISFKRISEFVQSTPYFIPETKTTFTIGSPHSIAKLREIKNIVAKAIYSSSKAFPYLASLKLLHKYIILRSFIKIYDDFYANNFKDYMQAKLKLIMLAHCCGEICDTLKNDDIDKISDDYMLIQTENTLVLVFYDDDEPDAEEYNAAKLADQYYTITGTLYKGNRKITERLPLDSYMNDFISTHISELYIKQITNTISSKVIFSFIRDSWQETYNIRNKLKDDKKKKKAIDILNKMII